MQLLLSTVAAEVVLDASSAVKGFAEPKPKAVISAAAHRDSAGLQREIDRVASLGGGVIKSLPNQVYELRAVGSKSFRGGSGGYRQSFCLEIPAGVSIDFSDSVLRLAEGSETALLCNRSTAAKQDRAITVSNVVLDGADRPNRSGAALLTFYGVQGLTLQNVTVRNAQRLGALIYGCDNVNADDLVARSTRGQAWTFGLPTPGQEVRDSQIGRIECIDIQEGPDYCNLQYFPGNPVYAVAVNTTFDSIVASRHAAGIKFDGGSCNWRVQNVALSSSTGGLNSGFKVQGTTDRPVINGTVGTVTAGGQRGTGLYLQNCRNITVRRYSGTGNARSGQLPDVWIAGQNVQVLDVASQGAGGNGVHVRPDAVSYHLGTVAISSYGATVKAAAALSAAGGKGRIDLLEARQSLVNRRLSQALNVYGAGAELLVSRLIASSGMRGDSVLTRYLRIGTISLVR